MHFHYNKDKIQNGKGSTSSRGEGRLLTPVRHDIYDGVPGVRLLPARVPDHAWDDWVALLV